MTVPRPLVRLTRNYVFTYQRPRIDGWPLIVVPSMLGRNPMKIVPISILVAVSAGARTVTLVRVEVTGEWVSTRQPARETLDLPGDKRRHRALAPSWVAEIAQDALDRAGEGIV